MPLFAILTLFPDTLAPYVRESILGIAQAKGLVEILLVDFRDFTRDRHRTVDDRPFGGGPGMVLKPEPIADCVEWLEARHGPFRKFVLCPGGRPFCQELARELAGSLASDDPDVAPDGPAPDNPDGGRVLLLAGRYEGFDERLREELGLEALSIGDYVLAGGELPALVVVEAIVRLLPGVLGDERSASEDSFSEPGLLDCPHYTRPRIWRGREVPEVLLSGDHQRIQEWRKEQARLHTQARRPDLSPPARANEPSPAHGCDDPRPGATPTDHRTPEDEP